jgi:enediyne biosynthesis protein E4
MPVEDRQIFTTVTEQAGIAWRQFSGESPDRFLIETMGGGVAFLDFDGDGLLDLFFVNGGETPHGKSGAPVRNALYRNLGNGRFEEVGEKAGVAHTGFYGMGVAAGDFDNDGFPDLFVSGFPSSALFHNNRDGTFTDITEQSGLRNAGRWAASAAWFDFDRDGLLDLVVTNYAQFSFTEEKKCEINGTRAYCAQTSYTGMPLGLFHNEGNGRFSDVSERSGLGKLVGRALGVVAIDVNGDGWTDLFVARDASPNLLLINQKNGTFRDVASDAEVAYDAAGTAKAGMGVDAGDVNGDGRPDLVITNFNDQDHSLFLGTNSAVYDDRTAASGLARHTRKFVGWGIHYIDFDNDGSLDLLVVNGHINQAIEATRVDVTYKEPPLLLRNNGKGVFEGVSRAGDAFRANYSARGLAVGDWNNDGKADAVFTCLNGPPVLLRNDSKQDNSWIGLELRGSKSNRDAVGAKITVEARGTKLVRWVTGGSSYLSSHDKRVLVGLGPVAASSDVRVEIQWPSGGVQRIAGLQPGRYHKVVEAVPAP